MFAGRQKQRGGAAQRLFQGYSSRRPQDLGGPAHFLAVAVLAGCYLAFAALDLPSAAGLASPGSSPERRAREVLARSLAAQPNEDVSHTNRTDHSTDHHVSGAVNPSVFFLVVFFASALAQSITHMLPHEIRPPHSVLLYFIGTFMAYVAMDLVEGSEFGVAITSFAHVDPHIIFWVFLPALLFEDAAGAEWPVIQRVMPSALLLALPGVIINTVLTGAFVRYCMNGWSWWMSLLLGSILSATDPVAVVGALTALSAPAKLSHLISGESLFNDGSAVALFQIFLNVAGGNSEFRIGNAIGTLCRLALGGPALGVAVAVVASQWMKHARALNVQVLIIVCCVYGCFFVGEHNFKVSGVLAVVCFGLYMSAVGRYSINVGIEHEYHSIVKFLALISHESIFIIAGIIGYKFMTENAIQWRDFGELFLLYIAIHVTRTLVIVMFWPLLSRMGYGVTWKEAIICIYGGLRGAVGLAMASVATGEWELGPDSLDGKRIGFHTAGIVVLTLLINGTTITSLYKWLQVDPTKGSRHHDKLLKVGLLEADSTVCKLMEEFKQHWFFYNCDFDIIEQLIPKLAEVVRHEKLDFFGKKKLHHLKKAHVDEVLEGLATRYRKRLDDDPNAFREHCQAKLQRTSSIGTFRQKEQVKHAARSRSFSPFDMKKNETGKESIDFESEEMMSEVYQTVANATMAEFTEAYEERRLPVAAYRILVQAMEYQETAIYGELGLPKYGIHYPDFLASADEADEEIRKLADEPRITQMKKSFMVGWLYLQDMLSKPRHWHMQQLRRLIGNQTIALDWVLLSRNFNILLQYVSTCHHILEDTSVFAGFEVMLSEPLQKVKEQAVTSGMEQLMAFDYGMFVILEHLMCARRILVQMRHLVEHQHAEGTLTTEDVDRISHDVIKPSERVLEEFLPGKNHLRPLDSCNVDKVRPWLDRLMLDLVLERAT